MLGSIFGFMETFATLMGVVEDYYEKFKMRKIQATNIAEFKNMRACIRDSFKKKCVYKRSK